MQLTVLKQKPMKLLSRERVTFEAKFDAASPARKDLVKEIAKKLKKDEKLVVVKHVYTKFGEKKAKVIAAVYDDEKSMKRIEEEHLTKRGKPKESKEEGAKSEAGEAKPEEKKEEKPAEPEKKEEPKAEEKKE